MNSYDKKFKDKVIKEVSEVGNVALVARKYDLPKSTLQTWYLGAVPFLGNEYSSEKKYQNIFNFYVKWKKLSSNYHKPHGKKILI